MLVYLFRELWLRVHNVFLPLRGFDAVLQDLLVLLVQLEGLAEPLVVVVVCYEVPETLLQLLQLPLSHYAIRLQFLVF